MCPVPADVTGPSGFAAAPRAGRGPRKLAFAQTRAALIRPALRCSPVTQRPAQGTPPASVDTPLSCSLSLRERAGVRASGLRDACKHRTPTKPGMRCGSGDPLCVAEARSLSRIRARDCGRRRAAPRRPSLPLGGWRSTRSGKPGGYMFFEGEFERDPAKGEHCRGARRAGAVGSHGPHRMPGVHPRASPFALLRPRAETPPAPAAPRHPSPACAPRSSPSRPSRNSRSAR